MGRGPPGSFSPERLHIVWDVGPGDQAFFPTKWMSKDGRTCYLVFSGDDTFAVRKVTFEV